MKVETGEGTMHHQISYFPSRNAKTKYMRNFCGVIRLLPPLSSSKRAQHRPDTKESVESGPVSEAWAVFPLH